VSRSLACISGSVTLDPKWKRDLCIGAENLGRNFDLTIVDDMNVLSVRDGLPGLKLGHLFHKCWQMRIQSKSGLRQPCLLSPCRTFPRIFGHIVCDPTFFGPALYHTFFRCLLDRGLVSTHGQPLHLREGSAPVLPPHNLCHASQVSHPVLSASTSALPSSSTSSA
jgi:hypothetical protein